ncbi:MAG: FecR domain-containing protein [Sandaracinaceae bacterium]|nr:FecR domain-containing protein [Sandaracinaceae bacterium]
MVTLAAGAAERLEAGEAAALLAGEELREGQSLRTGADGALHVRLSEGTGIALAAETELALSRAREDGVELSLARGRVDSAVAPLASGSTYVILCAGYRVEVRGTRFVVSYLDGVVGVDVAEGVVVVTAPDESATELTAPARWRSSGEAEGEPSAVEPRAVRGAEGAPVLVTIAHPELVRWEIDATSFTGGGPVRILLPAGEHEVRGWDARGRLFTALVPVSGAAVAIERRALTRGAAPAPGHLEPEGDPAGSCRAARCASRGCYERTLRDHPQVYGRLRMRVTVGVMGDVRRVSVLGADASETAQLRDCITRVASGWTFRAAGRAGDVRAPAGVQLAALTPASCSALVLCARAGWCRAGCRSCCSARRLLLPPAARSADRARSTLLRAPQAALRARENEQRFSPARSVDRWRR